MLCIAIVNIDDEKGLIKTLGKKKLKECGLLMRVQDEYTLICDAGHIRVMQDWEDKSFQEFFTRKGKPNV